jgi:uncharacterized protein (DUF362 family)
MNRPRTPASNRIDRKDFLRLLLAASGTTALIPLLNSCQALGLKIPANPGTPLLTPTETHTASSTLTTTATESSTPTNTPDPRTPIVLVKTRDRVTGIEKALRLWGQNPVLGKTVALKANFNSANLSPASTHRDTLRTLVQNLWALGATKITMPERSGSANTHTVLTELGIFDLATELNIDVVVLNDFLDQSNWEMVFPPGSHWQNGIPFSRFFRQADVIVQSCCLKPHHTGAITLSLKNSVGMVARYLNGINHDYMNEMHAGEIGKKIAEINFAYTPSLILLDGVEAFISGGPDQGQKVWGDVILVGADRVAIDAVGLAVLRYLGYSGPASQGSIFQQEQISRAIDLGLGVNGPDKIRLVTDDIESQAYAMLVQDQLLRN